MRILNKVLNKDFVVLNFSDFNMSVSNWEENTYESRLLCGTVTELVERVMPDLITFTGDFSGAEYDEGYQKSADLLNSFGIPWAFVWGNHDNQCGPESTDRLSDMMMSYNHCIFEKGDASLGSGNYVIRIDEEGIPIFSLILMDSHDRDEYITNDGEKKICWGRLSKAQLDWYSRTARELGTKNAILTHIPLYAFRTAFSNAWNHHFDPKQVTYDDTHDKKYWNPLYESSFGTCYEGICSYPLDGGEFDIVKDVGSTELILVGHDHINSFAIGYNDVLLAYALKTGAGCYWNENLNGGTVLKINKNGVSLEHVFVDAKKYL